MSIATQIQALQADKIAIANAITAKGGTVSTGDGFDDFATDIATIPAGVADISSAAEMDAKVSTEPVGTMYHYTGTTTSKYINGLYYKIEDNGNIYTVSSVPNYTYTFVEDTDRVYVGHGKVYKSNNQNKHNTTAAAKLTVPPCTSFKVWINSYAESNYDYTMLGNVDNEAIPTAYTAALIHTKGYQYNPGYVWNESYWKSYTFTNLTLNEHYVYITYRKDSSGNSGDDTGRFIVEDIVSRYYKPYRYTSGNVNLTTTAITDVNNYATAQVVDANLAAANIKKDVTILGITGVYSGGGGSGYKVYFYHQPNNGDQGYIQINGDTAIKLTQQMPDTSGAFYYASSVCLTSVETLKLWGFDHCGTYPSVSSSWIRWRLHGGSTWNNYTCVRGEASAQLLTLTADIDIEICENTCLNKGTLITMADGTKKPVEEIEIGDIVKGYDGDKKVRHSQKGAKQYLEFRDIWKFSDGKEIITTGRHEFYNYDKQKMMYLDEWEIGDRGYSEDGAYPSLIEHIHEDIPCMHFSIWTEENKEGYGENYFAGGLLSGNRYTGDLIVE